jgi:hypothetical protein
VIWWSFAVGIGAGVCLTPVTYRVAEWWWTRHYRRSLAGAARLPRYREENR